MSEMVIEQTNRTILFEQINPNYVDLCTLISQAENVDSLTDEMIDEIEEKLVIHSYQELLEKFKPALYLSLSLDRMDYVFSEKKTYAIDVYNKEISYEKQENFVSMLAGMMDYKLTKKMPAQRTSNLAECIFPMQDIESFLSLRKELKESFMAGKKRKASTLLRKSKELLLNQLLLLQIMLYDGKVFDMTKKKTNDFIKLNQKEEMQVEVVCQSKKFENSEIHLNDKIEEFEAWVYAFLNKENIPAKEFVVYNLLSLNECITYKAKEYGRLYNSCVQLYGDMLTNFWEKSRNLVQIMLGIKAFFLQYGLEDQKEEMKPSILIANMAIESFEDNKMFNALSVFLNSVNQKNTHESTIWYAILPYVENARKNTSSSLRERFEGTGKKKKLIHHKPEHVIRIMDTLSKYKIQMFLGSEADDANTFQGFAQNGIDVMMDDFSYFHNLSYTQQIIPCYPNFSLLSREQTKINLNKAVCLSEDERNIIGMKEANSVWLSELFIDASFVAAGLVAAYQCPRYLEAKFKRNVLMQVPGVAYHILEGNNRSKTKTWMPKEIFGYNEELLAQIMRRGCGIIFGCERAGVTVLTDKTLALIVGNNISISNYQTMTYLERVIRSVTQDYKVTLIKQFFVRRQDNLIQQWTQNKTMINSLFKEDEQIEYQIDEENGFCNFKVSFRENNIESKVKVSR